MPFEHNSSTPFEILISKIEEEEGNLSDNSERDNIHSPENKMIQCILEGLLFIIVNCQNNMKIDNDLVYYINHSEYSDIF